MVIVTIFVTIQQLLLNSLNSVSQIAGEPRRKSTVETRGEEIGKKSRMIDNVGVFMKFDVNCINPQVTF